MTTHIFASDEEFRLIVRVLADGEEYSGVDSPSLVEDVLLSTQTLRQFTDARCRKQGREPVLLLVILVEVTGSWDQG